MSTSWSHECNQLQSDTHGSMAFIIFLGPENVWHFLSRPLHMHIYVGWPYISTGSCCTVIRGARRTDPSYGAWIMSRRGMAGAGAGANFQIQEPAPVVVLLRRKALAAVSRLRLHPILLSSPSTFFSLPFGPFPSHTPSFLITTSSCFQAQRHLYQPFPTSRVFISFLPILMLGS